MDEVPVCDLVLGAVFDLALNDRLTFNVSPTGASDLSLHLQYTGRDSLGLRSGVEYCLHPASYVGIKNVCLSLRHKLEDCVAAAADWR